MLLRGFALPFADDVLGALGDISARAPFRHMTTPWGAAMSVAMTNCGDAGWLTDRAGYRYDGIDPETGQAVADNAGVLSRSGKPCRGSGRLPGLCAGYLLHPTSSSSRLFGGKLPPQLSACLHSAF